MPLSSNAFLPTTREEMDQRGWDELDVLFINGDAYVDHPAFGVPLLARLLEAEGFRVGIISQPDWRDPESFKVMGRPRLYAAISSGAMDSMVNHYTAMRRLRRDDAYTPGGQSGARPNRAVIAYTASVKNAFSKLPVIIGGIEASLRRLAHYDYWDNKVRRSVLVDSKADLLVYGMAEKPLLEITRLLDDGESISSIRNVRGTAYISSDQPDGCMLPSFEDVASSHVAYLEAHKHARKEHDPYNDTLVSQAHGTRHVVLNPPALPLESDDLDRIYALPFTRCPHPSYAHKITAYEQIRFSLTSHRGCCGGCSFCAIAVHQGKDIQSRSEASLLDEARGLLRHPDFKGALSDVGGPTANMYGVHCGNPKARKSCRRDSCLHPSRCRNLSVSAKRSVRMLKKISGLQGINHVPVSSGIRHDLLAEQPEYFRQLLYHHVGGLLKVAPETLSVGSAKHMAKPAPEVFESFLVKFREETRRLGKRYGVVPYLIAGHPGCTLDDVINTALFLKKHRLRVEQVQIFTPTPATRSTCMWYTNVDPSSGEKVHVPSSDSERRLQKAVLLYHLPENRTQVKEAFKKRGRMSELGKLLGDEKVRPNGKRRRR